MEPFFAPTPPPCSWWQRHRVHVLLAVSVLNLALTIAFLVTLAVLAPRIAADLTRAETIVDDAAPLIQHGRSVLTQLVPRTEFILNHTTTLLCTMFQWCFEAPK